MEKYTVLLKSGVSVQIETAKNPIGLWIWSSRQRDAKILDFGEHCILDTEIAMITKEENSNV